MVVHLRTGSDLPALAAALRQTVRTLDETVPVFDVHTVRDDIDRSLLRERFVGTVTSLFGALALVLAGIGLYGTLSYTVARRTREFGIRMAIGARAGSIVRLVLSEAVWLLAAGLALGLVRRGRSDGSSAACSSRSNHQILSAWRSPQPC